MHQEAVAALEGIRTTARDERSETVRRVAVALILSIALTTLAFALGRTISFNVADEGYLWYGVIRTTHGEVPIRDFRSYDPGRYYWSAAYAAFRGDGLVALRESEALFQIVTVALGLVALGRVERRWWVLLLAGIAITSWTFAGYKVFDSTLPLAGLWLAARVAGREGPGWSFLAGLFVGLAAFIGRNHGLYLGVGFLVLLLLDRSPGFARRLALWCGGIVVGSAPLLLMFALVPGYLAATASTVRLMLEHGATNISLPVPWPWTLTRASIGSDPVSAVTTSLLFVAIPAAYALAAIFLVRTRHRAPTAARNLLLASTCLGVPYLHYIFARADPLHLSLGVAPFLVGCLAFSHALNRPAGSRVPTAWAFALAVVSLCATVPLHPFAQKLADPSGFVACDLRGDEIWIHRGLGSFVDSARRIERELIRPGERILIAPHRPGMYAILGRESPAWESFFAWHDSEARQRLTIAQLESNNTAWALIGDLAPDERDELRFRNTQPLVWAAIQERFEVVPVSSLPPAYTLWKRKGAGDVHPWQADSSGIR